MHNEFQYINQLLVYSYTVTRIASKLPQVHRIKVVTRLKNKRQNYNAIVVILPDACNSITMSPFISAEVHL